MPGVRKGNGELPIVVKAETLPGTDKKKKTAHQAVFNIKGENAGDRKKVRKEASHRNDGWRRPR